MLGDEDFQAFATLPSAKQGQKRNKFRDVKKRQELDKDGLVLPLSRLCLLSLADNMKTVWVKDYEENYLDRYHFMHIMGPFNILPGGLVKELTNVLCSRKQLSRAALHLLVVPQLRGLSLATCPGLVTPRICSIIAARCQYLSDLDLSGAQQASSQAQKDMLSSLPALRSLSLAGTPCDQGVIQTIVHCCPALCYLDVSRCHFLSPAALMPLGSGASFDCVARCTDSSAGSDAATCPPSASASSTVTDRCHSSSPSSSSTCALPLRCLLATDIGFGAEEGEPAAVAAYLLLSLPFLEEVALEGLDWAFGAIHRREFDPTEEFTRREGVPRLEEVWRERWRKQRIDRRENEEAGTASNQGEGEEEEERWEVHGTESPDGNEGEDSSRDEEQDLLAVQKGGRGGIAEKDMVRGATVAGPGGDRLILRLREIQALSSASLEVVGWLCPHIQSICVNVDSVQDAGRGRSQGSLLATGLGTWSGQLRRLTLHHTGPLRDLLPSLQEIGSALVSLTLEGVKTSPHSPLLEALQACPRLRELLISAQPPTTPAYEDEVEELVGARDLLSLPHLYSLTLNFDYEHQRKPVMSWRALERVLLSLLWGSPLLETVSLTALPCHLNPVLSIISTQTWKLGHHHHPHQHLPGAGASSPLPSAPLGRVTHLGLARSDVTMATVSRLVEGCRHMRFMDLSCCWEISRIDHQDALMSPQMSAVRFVWQ
ncbi:unnamed protein product [Merluccius merluccius]